MRLTIDLIVIFLSCVGIWILGYKTGRIAQRRADRERK